MPGVEGADGGGAGGARAGDREDSEDRSPLRDPRELAVARPSSTMPSQRWGARRAAGSQRGLLRQRRRVVLAMLANKETRRRKNPAEYRVGLRCGTSPCDRLLAPLDRSF